MTDVAPPLFSAVLRPNRSLSRVGFRWLIGVVGLLNLGMGTAFYLNGAWPVVGLMGLDLLLLAVAFHVSYRSGQLCETVELTEDRLTVARLEPARPARVFVFQPYWLRMSLDEPVRHDSHLRLSSHGQTIIVGSFLAPEERADFARALRMALERLRQPAPTLPAPTHSTP
jgi:uncharacterized membrane protein